MWEVWGEGEERGGSVGGVGRERQTLVRSNWHTKALPKIIAHVSQFILVQKKCDCAIVTLGLEVVRAPAQNSWYTSAIAKVYLETNRTMANLGRTGGIREAAPPRKSSSENLTRRGFQLSIFQELI